MTSATKLEDTWVHHVSSISEQELSATRVASPAELAELAGRLDILAVERLKVDYRLEPLARGRYRLTAQIEARVRQACVVTLDPVVSEINEAVDVEFRPASAIQTPGAEEQTILDAPEHEPIDGQRLAVGRVIVETLAAALPAFPRAADAELEQNEAGPAEGGTANPFAALAGWKPKDE